MSLFSVPIRVLDDLFVHRLQDIHQAGRQITRTLSQRIGKVTDPAIRTEFEAHLRQTRHQIGRLEGCSARTAPKPGRHLPGDRRHHQGGRGTCGDIDDQKVPRTALLACAQAVGHDEITRYGTLIVLASQLGRTDLADSPGQMLPEKAADAALTVLAEGGINRRAATT